MRTKIAVGRRFGAIGILCLASLFVGCLQNPVAVILDSEGATNAAATPYLQITYPTASTQWPHGYLSASVTWTNYYGYCQDILVQISYDYGLSYTNCIPATITSCSKTKITFAVPYSGTASPRKIISTNPLKYQYTPSACVRITGYKDRSVTNTWITNLFVIL